MLVTGPYETGDTSELSKNLIQLAQAIVANPKDLPVSFKARALSLFLSIGVGAVLLSAAPAFGESPTHTTVRVAKPATNLKRIRYAAPAYPEKALQNRLSGFVTIEFIINTKGEPTGLRVVDAVPAQIFERSVLTAARRWRYQPPVVNNVPTETPTRTIVFFESHT
jgi:TonB family protein